MKAVSLTALAVIFLASCQSAPPPIPADAASEIYFQRAQAASDLSQYAEALAIYREFLANRTDATREEEFSARYEVAFLLLKEDRTAEAKTAFEALLSDYDDLDKSSGAPAWVKVLAQKKLQEIKDHEPKAAAVSKG